MCKRSQNEIVFEFFKGGAKLSPSLIFPLVDMPLTSLRRTLNTLENRGDIRKTDVKIFGLYGRKEYMYKKI